MQESHYGVPLERSDQLRLRRHRNYCRPDRFAQWLEGFGKERRLAVDLFSGAGGLSHGLRLAGWTTAAAVDFDERALETHAANFPGMSLCMDLGNPKERDRLEEILEPARGKIDLVAGGPPCQPFSRAGRSKIRSLVEHHGRDSHDRRKELWSAYLDVVKRIKPRAVLMENVPDMGLGDDFFVIRTIEQQLEELGYATQVRLVDAWRYGVPQHRKRLILLARNDVEEFRWQAEVPDEKRTTLREAIGDLPSLRVVPLERVGAREMGYDKSVEGLSEFAKDMRKRAPAGVVWDHMTRRVRNDDWIIFDGMTAKTLYPDIDPKLQRYSAEQFTDRYKRLDWTDLSRSITAHIAKDGYWYIHPSQNRTLTVREAARVQTFPDRFRFAGTRSDAFRQIGNAVPPLLGKAAASVLLPSGDVQNGNAPAVLRPHWRRVRQDLTDWAKKRRQGDDWYQLPQLSSVHAAVVAVLSGARLKRLQLRRMIESVQENTTLTENAHETLLDAAPTEAARTRIARLARLAGKPSVWHEERRNEVPAQVEMKPAEERLYRLLIDEDLLWIGQGAIRVAARLNGSKSDRTNRLSDGRVDLVKLVGAGEEAPLRMAALRLIGDTLCRPTRPLCDDCPLSQYCTDRESVSEDPLFSDAVREPHNETVPVQARGEKPRTARQH
ncbi:DNA (cytosine-5)-methyltransferase 1 [Streptomyces sp. Amel2xB2]|uniref:DNA (cytosine-5-)-methyltransferase n=1 Tax=Streptomyces sp. Amel2xB2 TaxID=1305829 RepID=UPI000DBAC913|nr:DNA (cytosine-5-)-methyltransferase [Streptomyces sp. Amel2xB2]RAJ61673.1 DNA (cytosine-5)-methyltransferase 1 [Streptomyces sp. Amel2xB2]